MSRPERKSVDNADKQQKRLPIWMTQEETEALLNLLLQAPPLPDVSGDKVERLLCRVAEVQRAFSRASSARKRRRRPGANTLIIARRLLTHHRTHRTQ